MALDLTLLNSDLNYILADIPVTITIGSTDYTGSRGKLTNTQVYSDYGLGDEYEFTVYLNVNVLSSVPDNHSLVTISGTEYRIIMKDIDSADQSLILHLGSKYGKTD